MKNFVKKLGCFLALIVAVVGCLSFVACDEADMKTLSVQIQVVDHEEGTVETKTINIDLYGHLAPKTVNAIIKYANEGYYNNTVFYVDAQNHSNMIMLGTIKIDDNGNYVVNSPKPQIEGEFTYGGTTGSDLKNVEGAVGLWRTWFASDNSLASNGFDTGRASMYIPMEEKSELNDYFCVFGKIDLATYSTTFTKIKNALGTDNCDTYWLYYTGEYDQTKPNDYYGLTPHIITDEEYEELTTEEKDAIFDAEGEQFVEFNKKKIRISKSLTTGERGVYIKKVTVK